MIKSYEEISYPKAELSPKSTRKPSLDSPSLIQNAFKK
jgi:hypothetical protein